MTTDSSSSYPIIIGGCFRTGTTLLRRILDSHSRIHCPPEVKFFRDLYGAYKSDDLSSIRFFTSARQMGLTDDELLMTFGSAFVKSHELAARKQGKVRWADKNPENVLYLDKWERVLDGRFQFIHVVRHPLDTVAAMMEIGFEKTLPTDFKGMVNVYREYVSAGEAFTRENPMKSFTVRYEDLVAQPDTVLAEVVGFLGEEYEAPMIESFNAPGRQKGLEDPKISTTRTIHGKSIGRWKKDLKARQVKFVCKHCRPLFDLFDYELP